MTTGAKPVLKWVGGKRQLLKQYQPLIPAKFDCYHEPFFGGGAMFFHLNSTGFNQNPAVINDSNRELVNLYRRVRDAPQTVYHWLDYYPASQVTREIYDELRDRYNDMVETVDFVEEETQDKRAALLIWLNRHCFNGLYRVNKRGRFNVPMGRYKNPTTPSISHIRAVHEAFTDVKIRNKDFYEVLADREDGVGAGDFVYMDPPYVPITATADFTSYTTDGFTWEDQKRVSQAFLFAHQAGAKVMVSNHWNPELIKLYTSLGVEDVSVTGITARRSINRDGKKRGEISEVVIRNYTTGREEQ